jgi:hypothetical protein
MTWFSEGELFGEVCRCYRREVPWFWYRDVLLQAEQRGVIKLVQERDGKPFWWMGFEESVEIASDGLKKVLVEETEWKGV